MDLPEEESQSTEGEALTQGSLDLQSLPVAHVSNLPASTLTRLCRQKFTALLTGLESGSPSHWEWMHPTALETEHERLRIWSGNLGAMQAGSSSLEYRLRESTVILGNVVALLTELYQTLTKSIEVVSGVRLPLELSSRPDYTDDESSDTGSEEEEYGEDAQSISELAQHMLSIRDILSDLFKLSFKIRNSSTRPKSLKPALYREIDPETRVDKFEIYEQFDCRHVEQSFAQFRPNTDFVDASSQYGAVRLDVDFLVERIAHAITKRRRILRYWQRHSRKLASELTIDNELLIAEIDPTRHTTGSTSAPKTVKELPHAAPSMAEQSFLSQTDATRFDTKLDDSLDTQSVISYASTTFDTSGNTVDLPAPPPKNSQGTEFLCPYCGIVCPSRYAEGRAWRSHILQDLKPYICTYAECQNGEVLYGTRYEWLEHERLQHRRVWQCFTHKNQVFQSKAQLSHHLEASHAAEITTSQIESVLEVSEASKVDDRSHCPLCLLNGPFKRGLDNHIAFHLELFSTFSISNGLSTGDDEDSDRDEDSGRGRGLRSDSSQTPESLNFQSPRASSTHSSSKSSMDKPSISGTQREWQRLNKLSVDAIHPLNKGSAGLPPSSPLLEPYRGSYQSLHDMPSPFAEPIEVEVDDPDDTDNHDPLSPEDSTDLPHGPKSAIIRSMPGGISTAHRNTSRSNSRERPEPKGSSEFYTIEQDALRIANELTKANPEFRVLIDILPKLSHDQVMELRTAYKLVAKIQDRGINIAKHIKLKASGPFAKVAYVTALGQWESEAYWANFWYQSSSSSREMLIEALMGRKNSDIRLIKNSFKDKRYDDSLVKCMWQELKTDKFRTAVLTALEETRQEEDDVWPREYLQRDVDMWAQSLKSEGGETDMLQICVTRSDRHLRECLQLFTKQENGNFAKRALQKINNLVGEIIAHIINGVINRPARDAMLLQHALINIKNSYSDPKLGESEQPESTQAELHSTSSADASDEENPGAEEQGVTEEGPPKSTQLKHRYDLLISRLVRLHWEPYHIAMVKNEYRNKYGKDVENEVEDTLLSGDFRQFCLELLMADT